MLGLAWWCPVFFMVDAIWLTKTNSTYFLFEWCFSPNLKGWIFYDFLVYSGFCSVFPQTFRMNFGWLLRQSGRACPGQVLGRFRWVFGFFFVSCFFHFFLSFFFFFFLGLEEDLGSV